MLTALCPCRWYEHRQGLFILISDKLDRLLNLSYPAWLSILVIYSLWQKAYCGCSTILVKGGRQMERLVNKPPSHHGRKRQKKLLSSAGNPIYRTAKTWQISIFVKLLKHNCKLCKIHLNSYFTSFATVAFPTECLQVILCSHSAFRHRDNMVDFQKQVRLIGNRCTAKTACVVIALLNVIA